VELVLVSLITCAALGSGAAHPILSHQRQRNAAFVLNQLDLEATACAQEVSAAHPNG